MEIIITTTIITMVEKVMQKLFANFFYKDFAKFYQNIKSKKKKTFKNFQVAAKAKEVETITIIITTIEDAEAIQGPPWQSVK